MNIKINKDKWMSAILIRILVMVLLLFVLCSMMNIRFFSVVSGSMRPTIQEGSLIANRNIPFEEIQVGDIITYKMKTSDMYVTHRVIKVDHENKRILCKGDANQNSDDQFIRKEQYQGKMVMHIIGLGYLVILIKSEFGKLLCSMIIFGLFLSILHDIKGNRKLHPQHI